MYAQTHNRNACGHKCDKNFVQKIAKTPEWQNGVEQERALTNVKWKQWNTKARNISKSHLDFGLLYILSILLYFVYVFIFIFSLLCRSFLSFFILKVRSLLSFILLCDIFIFNRKQDRISYPPRARERKILRTMGIAAAATTTRWISIVQCL